MLIQNIKVTVDALVFRRLNGVLQLLLVKRKYDPGKGMWALPGGFVEDEEELEDAACRELEEETGLRLDCMTQLHTFGKVGRDTRGRNITVAYYAYIGEDTRDVAGGDDAADAGWVDVSTIKELAFDHIHMLEFALYTLKLTTLGV